MGLLEFERETIKADAVVALRTALVTGEGIGQAVRWCWYRNPMFAAALFTETVRARFPADCDVRELTRFIVRHWAVGSPAAAGFPAREAEALLRGTLGEVALLDEVHPGRFSYPELGSALLGALLGEWRPGSAEVYDLFGRAEGTLQAGQELSPGLGPAEEDWFSVGMHESPLARWAVGEQDGVTPGR
jgi:hypothetical protein